MSWSKDKIGKQVSETKKKVWYINDLKYLIIALWEEFKKGKRVRPFV